MKVSNGDLFVGNTTLAAVVTVIMMAAGMQPLDTGRYQQLAVQRVNRRCEAASCSTCLLLCSFLMLVLLCRCAARWCAADTDWAAAATVCCSFMHTSFLKVMAACCMHFDGGMPCAVHHQPIMVFLRNGRSDARCCGSHLFAVVSLTLLSKQLLVLHHEANSGHSAVGE
jgi:hypothetical protein